MGNVEAAAGEQLPGLGADAETRLPAEWVRRREQATDRLVLALLIAVQVAWVAALLYAAYIFI